MAKVSLREWINAKQKAKGLSTKEAKKNAGKYKSISAAKKAGSLYYTDKKGNVQIAAFAEDLKSEPKAVRPKARPDTVERVGGMYGDMTVAEKKEVDAANAVIKKEEAARRAILLEEAMDSIGISNETRKKRGFDPSNLAGPSAEARAKLAAKKKSGMNKGGMAKKKMAYNMGGMAKCGASNPATQKGSK
tara:strand:+ start:800 stop:1369 length:570 start_codon:yes stop_codon:yes gene_type:complete